MPWIVNITDRAAQGMGLSAAESAGFVADNFVRLTSVPVVAVRVVIVKEAEFPRNRRPAGEAHDEEDGDDRQKGHDIDRHGILRLHSAAPRGLLAPSYRCQ
jgi:hypothetical protein